MKIKSWIAVLLLLALAIVPVSSAPKGDDEVIIATSDSADVMQGLPGVYVLVESIAKDAEEDGLTKDDIQTDVELKLRIAGIKVLSRDESRKTPGAPILYVNVNTVKKDTRPLYAYSIDVKLEDNAVLERPIDLPDGSHKKLMVIGAVTWEKGSVGMVGASKLPTVRDGVKHLVDQFCNDYLKANPKK